MHCPRSSSFPLEIGHPARLRTTGATTAGAINHRIPHCWMLFTTTSSVALDGRTIHRVVVHRNTAPHSPRWRHQRMREAMVAEVGGPESDNSAESRKHPCCTMCHVTIPQLQMATKTLLPFIIK